MKVRKPIQAKSTERIIKAILPGDFKMVNDKTSNGYKFLNLLYGVEVDRVNEYAQEVYDNSFLETMDLSDDGLLYDLNLTGIPNSRFLNTTVSGGIPIKIVNWGTPGGESEFWDGLPTRINLDSTIELSGAVHSGNLLGLNYFRENPSGYGYFLLNSDVLQDNYLLLSGSQWRFNLDNVGNILNWTGLWPGVETFNYSEQGRDDVIYPLGSGLLNKKYPLTRRIRDNSGVYWDIDHYEPYLGWVRDENNQVVALINYSGDYYYDADGKKIWYRTAFNNPYGSGNYTTEYLPLRNIPISGTLRVYDIDNVDISGNAIEISSTGSDLYKLQSTNMLLPNGTGIFDPVYLGYDSTVPLDRGFGSIEGLATNYHLTTSWEYQRAGGYIDEGTMQYIEGSGAITNLIKIVNPVSRYLVEYDFKTYNQAKYITSLEASRYINLDTDTPIYSISNVFNNSETLEYEFTRDPNYTSEKARFITFGGWRIRPNSRISKIDFTVPIEIQNGPLNSFIYVSAVKDSIGYPLGFIPNIYNNKNYILNCPFAQQVSLGAVTETDLSGSGNFLDWTNTGDNEIYRIPIDTYYGKRIKYVNNSGYFNIASTDFIKSNTFFRFRFRSDSPRNLTLMELSQDSGDYYMKVEVDINGTVIIRSTGVDYFSRDRISFGEAFTDLIVRYYPDEEFTTNPVYEMYLNTDFGYRPVSVFYREIDDITVSGTYLHVYKNCTIDVDTFQIYYATNYDTLNGSGNYGYIG
jgi:hypothetical protein